MNSSEITEAELDEVSKKNIFGLATVGLTCCGGTISIAAALNIPIMGAIVGIFTISTLFVRFYNKIRIKAL